MGWIIGKRTAQSGRRPLGTPVGCNGSQQRFPAERLFWKQYIGLQDAGWPQEKLQPPKQIAEKWAVLLLKQYVLVLYSDENTCYNIAMAQVSVAQEGKLPEMHERLIILRELLTRAAPSSCGHCAFSSWKQAGTRKRSFGLFVLSSLSERQPPAPLVE